MTQSLTDQKSDYKSPFVLGLDVGTSSTRTLLFDATGATVSHVQSQRTYQLTTSDQGEVSVDADMLLGVVAETIDEALKQAGPLTQQISAVAIDTFWHSLLGIDESGHPLTPVITWEDTRPYSAVARLRATLDEKAVHDRTGARFHASYWPAKLLWLAEQQPETFKKATRWLSFGEYLHQKLLGHAICSLSMASGTGLLVTREHHWDAELLRVLNVRSEQMPELGDLKDSVKGLTEEYAQRWPDLHNVPWFPAIGDGASACIGSGCASIDNWSLTIGTSSALRVVIPPEQTVPPLGLWLYLIDAKRAVLGGALSEGGNMLNWLDTVLKLPALKDAEPLVEDMEPDSHGLTILPFISGERSLGWHGEAHMTIAGIGRHTTPAELLRAGKEALSYQLAMVYEQICVALNVKHGTPKVIGSGGALLGSTLLKSILADTLATPLYPSRDHEASARGAALLALEAMGVIPDVALVSPNLDEPTRPNDERGKRYRQALERQRKLYEILLGPLS